MEIFNVLAAASASFVFGAIWYMVLFDLWMTASGVALCSWQTVEFFKPTSLYSECHLDDCGRRDDTPCARGQWRDLNSFGRD